ncbi:hypothetical protein L916_14305 [Phytophthora nicotianae]|uniref:RxLR effector protein n=2 Tax=Phytophthora nicotianae TaxID=4792 RepID=V9E9W6_PHYNI|nr:hypothetical protein F443_18557 [Phytophthora nicotianae P1569]ETL33186.1 hypothetical protein L916_14305 [Phytophthora nicotianae]
MRLTIVLAWILATFHAARDATVADQRFLRTNHVQRTTTAADVEERTIPDDALMALVSRFNLDWKAFKVNVAAALRDMDVATYAQYQEAYNELRKLHKSTK